MNEDIQKDILQELKIIKKLLAQNILSGETQTKQISKLGSLGFQSKEIAEILGTTANTVNVALSRLRKSKNKKEINEPTETEQQV